MITASAIDDDIQGKQGTRQVAGETPMHGLRRRPAAGYGARTLAGLHHSICLASGTPCVLH